MTTTIRLEPDLEDRLDRLARRSGHSKAHYLRRLITSEALSELEWEEEVLRRARDVRSGRSTTLSEAELRAELGLAD